MELKDATDSFSIAPIVAELKPNDSPSSLSKYDCESWTCAFAPDESYFAWSCGCRIVVLVPWNPFKACPLSVNNKDDKGRQIQKDVVTIDCGHLVWALAFSFSGPMKASRGNSNTKLFQSKGDLILATGLSNSRIRIWDVSTGNLILELMDHKDVIRDVSFAPDGSLRLVSASRDMTLKVWDLKDNGNLIKTLRGHHKWVFACSWAPNSRLLASVGSGKMVIVWDAETYSLRQRLVGHTNDVVACDFSSDSALLATASWDTRVIIWDPYTGESLKVFGHLFPPPRLIYASSANGPWVRGIRFSSSGSFFASVADDGYVRFWDLHLDDDPVEVAPLGHALCCSYSPSGRTLAVGTRSGGVTFYKPPTRVLSLKRLSRSAVCKSTSSTSVNRLEVPKTLHEYLRYKDWD